MDATKLQEIEAQLDELACSDHGCVVSRPKGMGTNGGCLCIPRGIHPDQRVMLRKALTLRQHQADALVAEVRRLTAALATVTTERDEVRAEIGAREVSLSTTIARLRDEKAALRTQVDVLGDTAHRIADAWNQIAGHFLVSPSPANAERIARLACAAAVVRDEAIATRDEARADLARLRAEHAAALAAARREGAEGMREVVKAEIHAAFHYNDPPDDGVERPIGPIPGQWEAHQTLRKLLSRVCAVLTEGGAS